MKEKMIKFYNDNASLYDKEQDEFGFVRIPEWEIALKAIRKIAQINHSVLEIGAGTGRFTLEIAPLVERVTAIDISSKMLDCMSQKLNQKGISNVRQIHGNFMEMPFNEKFDMIVSFSAIEYIKDKALFAKISGLLAPGGHLILTTSHNTFFRWWGRMGNFFRQGIFMDAYSKKKMTRLLTANGLEVKGLTDLCLKSFFSKGILLFVHAKKG